MIARRSTAVTITTPLRQRMTQKQKDKNGKRMPGGEAVRKKAKESGGLGEGWGETHRC